MDKHFIIEKFVNKKGVIWRDKNLLRHHPTGPAVIGTNGHQEWWWHGQRHREGGPAVIYPNGTEEWWRYDQPHRDDGPAFSEGDKASWWYYGKSFDSLEKWANAVGIYETELFVELKLLHGL